MTAPPSTPSKHNKSTRDRIDYFPTLARVRQSLEKIQKNSGFADRAEFRRSLPHRLPHHDNFNPLSRTSSPDCPGTMPEAGRRNAGHALARRQVAVISGNGVSALAARSVTTIIPIFFQSAIYQVASGLVASRGHPGGNTIGVSYFGATMEDQ